MPLTVAEVLETPNSSSTTQVLSTASGTAAGNTLVVLYGSDFYELADMPDIASSAGTPSLLGWAEIGTGLGHIKAYTVAVTSGGAKTVTIPAHIDCDITGVVLRLAETATLDGTTASQIDTSNTVSAHVAPSVTTTGADRLLVCCWLKTNAGSGWTGDQYSVQASMTKRAETAAPPFCAMAVATEDIAASGATGSRTATWFEPKVYGAISFALAGSGGGAAVDVPLSRRPRMGALLQL